MLKIGNKDITPYLGDKKLKKITLGTNVIWEETAAVDKIYYGFVSSGITKEMLTEEYIKENLSSILVSEISEDGTEVSYTLPRGTKAADFESSGKTKDDYDEWFNNIENEEYEAYLNENRQKLLFVKPLNTKYVIYTTGFEVPVTMHDSKNLETLFLQISNDNDYNYTNIGWAEEVRKYKIYPTLQ